MPSLDVQATIALETAQEAHQRKMADLAADAVKAVDAELARQPAAREHRAIAVARAARLWVGLVSDRQRWERYNAHWYERAAIKEAAEAAEAAQLDRVVAAVVASVLEDAAAGRREHPETT